MAEKREKPDGLVESFYDAVSLTRNGEAAEELSQEFHNLIAAVQSRGTGGKLTLELKVKPGKPKAGEATVEITAEIRVASPKVDYSETILFAKQDGTTSRQPFAQAVIPFESAGRRKEA